MTQGHYDKNSFKEIRFNGKEYYFKPDLYLDKWFYAEFFIKKTRKILFFIEYEYYSKVWKSKSDYHTKDFDNMNKIKNIVDTEIQNYFNNVTDINKFDDWDGNLTPQYEDLVRENKTLKKQLGKDEVSMDAVDNKNLLENVNSNNAFLKNLESDKTEE